MKYTVEYQQPDGLFATIDGRYRNLRGLARAMIGVSRDLGRVIRIHVGMTDALKTKLVSDAISNEIVTAFGDRMYHVTLWREESMAATIGRKGGRRRGKRKNRGTSAYYRKLAAKRQR